MLAKTIRQPLNYFRVHTILLTLVAVFTFQVTFLSDPFKGFPSKMCLSLFFKYKESSIIAWGLIFAMREKWKLLFRHCDATKNAFELKSNTWRNWSRFGKKSVEMGKREVQWWLYKRYSSQIGWKYVLRCLTCMVFNYASGRKHAKHQYILAVNLPDTFRCPKRQIATKKYKIICLSFMCCLKQKNSITKYNLRTVFLRFASD